MIKISRLFFSVTVVMGLLTCAGKAQEDNVMTATTALQGVLSNLQESVAKLSAHNEQLAAKDKYFQDQIKQLQVQLGQMESQSEVLNSSVARLEVKNPRLSQQITDLEEENYDLDNRIQKNEATVKLTQDSMDAGYQEYQQLLLQLKGLQNITLPATQPMPMASQEDLGHQKEKLKLMKMIYDSQMRQEALHESILDYQKKVPMLPAASAMARQRILKEQIKDLEIQVESYPQENTFSNPNYSYEWDDNQLSQLTMELKVLSRNYAQLRNLVDQMSQRVQSTRMTIAQREEADKLKASIDNLVRQGDGLRANLEDLRSQMVDLDKRKSHLQEMVNHLP